MKTLTLQEAKDLIAKKLSGYTFNQLSNYPGISEAITKRISDEAQELINKQYGKGKRYRNDNSATSKA